jgi:hypothetical protein
MDALKAARRDARALGLQPRAWPVSADALTAEREARLQRLIRRLPPRIQRLVNWLRRPSSRWLRIAAGGLLILGSFLSVLPVFGLWMLPLGLVLLAEDMPALRRLRDRVIDWVERRRPHWFAGADSETDGTERRR